MGTRRWLGSLILLIVPLGITEAQSVTGSIEGRVLSAQGDPLGNAAVTVSGPFLLGTRDATTDTRGHFLLLWLPAGTYTVRLRALGFRPATLHDVRVALGATGSLGDVRLAPQPVVLPEIVVSGERPLLDPTTGAAATVLDSATFLAVPTERNFRSLMTLAPQTSSSAYGDGVNVAGATGVENGYFADGIHITDPLAGDGSMNLPYNFVREVQVTTGGYEAEYGRTQGGMVNVITNSGGNEFHGQVLGFFTGNQLRATPRWGFGEAQVETFSQYDVGGSFGGPIWKDRLWFYAAYNPTFERHDATFPGIAVQRDVRATHLFAAKLSGLVGKATDVTLTLLGDPSRQDYVGPGAEWQPEGTVTDPRAVLWKLVQGGTAAALQVRHRLGGGVSLAWSFTRLDRRFDHTPRTGPVTDLTALAVFYDDVAGTASGNVGLSNQFKLARTAGQVSVSVLAGSHLVKLGAEYEANTVALDGHMSVVTRSLDSTYNWLQIDQHARAHNTVPAAYVEDAWELSPRLHLNLGVRAEGQFVAGDTGATFWIVPEIAPRLGFVFQPGELGVQRVYGSIGRFYEEFALAGPVIWSGVMTQTALSYPQNPLVDTTGGVPLWGVTLAGETTDRNVRGQYYDEVTAGYERRLGRANRVGVRGTYRTLRWIVEDGASDPSAPYAVGNPGRGALAFLPRARREYEALELTFERAGGPLTFLASYVLSRNWGNYPGVFNTDMLQAYGNCTAQFDFPDLLVNATGLLPNDRTHMVKFVGSYRFPIGLTVGTSAYLASGTPLSTYGTYLFYPLWSFVTPRGTAGRTPTTWNVDLRFAYELPIAHGARLRPRVLLDVFNVGNQRKALTYDQRLYPTPDQSITNPHYGEVTQYQAPLRARLGMAVDF
jgi:hypothetical protein